jgi:predicted ATPase
MAVGIKNVPGFADSVLSPRTGFAVVCGATGVGKTALLEAIFAGLSAQEAGRIPSRRVRLGTASIEVSIHHPNGEYIRVVSASEPATEDHSGFAPEVRLVDLGERTSAIQDFFKAGSVDIALEGYEPSAFTTEELGQVSRAIGKRYTEILVYEVEDGDLIRPFFRVTESGLGYDTLSMGTGELSAIYIAWTFRFITKGSIVLIEEPEAFLPPASHIGMFDLICVHAEEKDLGIVLSTHSTHIVSQVPHTSLIPVKRNNGVSSVPTSSTAKDEVLGRLGLQPARTGIGFTEDELGTIVAKELIAAFDLNLLHHIEIVDMKAGFGAIKTTIDNLPPIRSFSFSAILDGDMKATAEEWPKSNLCTFLPFETCMEKEFISAIEHDAATFAQLIGRTVGQVEHILEKSMGLEAHDAFYDTYMYLGLSLEQAAKACFSQWLAIQKSDEKCISFTEHLRKVLKIER